jgi:hypothetical protein
MPLGVAPKNVNEAWDTLCPPGGAGHVTPPAAVGSPATAASADPQADG